MSIIETHEKKAEEFKDVGVRVYNLAKGKRLSQLFFTTGPYRFNYAIVEQNKVLIKQNKEIIELLKNKKFTILFDFPLPVGFIVESSDKTGIYSEKNSIRFEEAKEIII